MNDFFNNIVSSIGITDVIDIVAVAYIVYKLIGFITETRAQQLVKGLLILAITFFLSDLLNLYALNWILKGTMQIGLIALIVVFQPELRRALEYLGRGKLVKAPFVQLGKEEAKEVVDQFVNAVDFFSQSQTGALIVFEREITLTDIVETGIKIDSKVSSQLLGNIFYEGAPLHDGALIVRGNRLYAAGCVLPLTQNKNLNKNLGTRHRAGIGITENSDALVIIVSKETGVISIAQDGRITRFLDGKAVEKTLLNLYLSGHEDSRNALAKMMDRIGRKKDAE